MGRNLLTMSTSDPAHPIFDSTGIVHGFSKFTISTSTHSCKIQLLLTDDPQYPQKVTGTFDIGSSSSEDSRLSIQDEQAVGDQSAPKTSTTGEFVGQQLPLCSSSLSRPLSSSHSIHAATTLPPIYSLLGRPLLHSYSATTLPPIRSRPLSPSHPIQPARSKSRSTSSMAGVSTGLKQLRWKYESPPRETRGPRKTGNQFEKWTSWDDQCLKELRNNRVKWSEIPQYFTDRSETACRVRFGRLFGPPKIHKKRIRKRKISNASRNGSPPTLLQSETGASSMDTTLNIAQLNK
jgi:hypothetical protein